MRRVKMTVGFCFLFLIIVIARKTSHPFAMSGAALAVISVVYWRLKISRVAGKRGRPMKRGGITAAELMEKLSKDPEYIKTRQEQDAQCQKSHEELRKAERPLIRDLQAAGFRVETIWDLVNTRMAYPEAIPILVAHLTFPYPFRIREGIARALTVKYAGDEAYRKLVDEFRSQPITANSEQNQYKWALGNAISIVARKKNYNEIIELIHDKSHGWTRYMMVMQLARLNHDQAIDVIIESLDDQDVLGGAVCALARLHYKNAREHIERARNKLEALLDYPDPWLRKRVQKALKKINVY